MYCNTCGTEIPASSLYCGQCGRAVPGALPPSRYRRLERPRQGRKIAGVCLGLARHFDVDPTLVRVLWLVLTLLFAVVFGVLAYVAAWILMPEEPKPSAELLTDRLES